MEIKKIGNENNYSLNTVDILFYLLKPEFLFIMTEIVPFWIIMKME